MASPDSLENLNSVFLWLRKVGHFLGNLWNLLFQPSFNFQPRVELLFCENNQKWPKTKRCFDTFDMWNPVGRKKNFWPVMNSMQLLILYSHKNDDVLNEWQLLLWKQKLWSSCRSNWTKYKKWIVSTQNEPHTLFVTCQLILIKRGKGNSVGDIFINYTELHDNYLHSLG